MNEWNWIFNKFRLIKLLLYALKKNYSKFIENCGEASIKVEYRNEMDIVDEISY